MCLKNIKKKICEKDWPSIAMRKTVNRSVQGRQSQYERPPIAMRKAMNCAPFCGLSQSVGFQAVARVAANKTKNIR